MALSGTNIPNQRRTDLRVGDTVVGHRRAGHAAGHSGIVAALRYNDAGEITQFLEASATTGGDNAVRSIWRPIDHYEEMYTARLYDSDP